MISVLIPTYNYKCYSLVRELQHQLESSGVKYEIIVADDGGKDCVSAISNHRINDLKNCRFIHRNKNVGRAAIRNYLVQESKGEWLLFIDSDAVVVRDRFIMDYLSTIGEIPCVIAGGLVNPEKMISKRTSLRYKYEKAAEYQWNVKYRRENPYNNFSTFNTMFHRNIIEKIPFDEVCVKYGYEDTLMGIELMKHKIPITHIDNPMMHVGFEPNEVYLNKALTAIDTLKDIGESMIPYSKVGSCAVSLQHKHLAWLVSLFYRVTEPLLKKNLIGSNPNLTVFSFYKLGYYLGF